MKKLFALLLLFSAPAYAYTPLAITSGSNDVVVNPPGCVNGKCTVATTNVINAQTGTSYAILSTDIGKTVVGTNAGSQAYSIAAAGTTGFEAGKSFTLINSPTSGVPSTGTITLTPTTSKINGASTLALAQNQSAYITSDGANYTAFLGSSGGGGSGTVTSVSVATANGMAGTVATATSTPAITLTTTVTGIVKGNGAALSAATAGTDYVSPSVVTAFTAGQAVTPSTVTVSTATFTPNLAASNNFNINLSSAGPYTLANPTNIVAGQSGVIVVNQDGTGSRTIGTYGTDYVFTNAAAPVLSTAANASDLFSYYVIDSTHIRLAPLLSTAAIPLTGSTGTPTCGTGCTSITAGSTNARGSMVSSSSVSAVTVNWSGTLSYTPICVISDSNTTTVADISTVSSSLLTVSTASAITSATIYWICVQ